MTINEQQESATALKRFKTFRAQSLLLKFGRGNAKLDKRIVTFSLPAGWTCPGASACLAKADRHTGKLTDGAKAQFRCFAATAEAMYSNVRDSQWHNFDLLKGKTYTEMFDLIMASLPPNTRILRVHVSGDFFSRSYFAAWMRVAELNPQITFYAYTKSLLLWVERQQLIPKNFKLTASAGGTHDYLITRHGLKTAQVVFSLEEATALGLAIDHDDSHAYNGTESFALLLHGTQARGSVAAKSLSALKAQGFTGYSK